jgi:hypothetical protein
MSTAAIVRRTDRIGLSMESDWFSAIAAPTGALAANQPKHQ